MLICSTKTVCAIFSFSSLLHIAGTRARLNNNCMLSSYRQLHWNLKFLWSASNGPTPLREFGSHYAQVTYSHMYGVWTMLSMQKYHHCLWCNRTTGRKKWNMRSAYFNMKIHISCHYCSL